MRLEVLCNDRIGIASELLTLLVKTNVDLRDIEIDKAGWICLHFSDIDFDLFSSLMRNIRRIHGVLDVRTVAFLPKEKRNTEFVSILNSLTIPAFSINLDGHIDSINPAVSALFKLKEDTIINQPIERLLPDFNITFWLNASGRYQREKVTIHGISYVMEIMPVEINDNKKMVLTSAVVTINPVVNSQGIRPYIPESSHVGFEHIIGSSELHHQLISQAKRLSDIDQSLLIQGETGTGKEMLARACHHSSLRSSKAFMVVNCASMPDDVAETELFGHAAGAFSNSTEEKSGIIEQADGGTIFFDEISEMSPLLQMKLLRFIQDGNFRRVGEDKEIHVDVGIIGASKKGLLELVEQGRFREDLYYRLNVLSLDIPPLRDRPSDIATLLDFFVVQLSKELQIVKPTIEDEVYPLLQSYTWPGNVRQLKSEIVKALTKMDGSTLHISHFVLPKMETPISAGHIKLNGSLDEMMKSYESNILNNLYKDFPSSRKLANRLSVSHTAIANKLRDYKIVKS